MLGVVMAMFFALQAPDTYPTMTNLRVMLGTQSVLILLSMATMLPLIVGEFDISLAANFGFATVLFGHWTATAGWPLGVALLATVVASAAISFASAVIITHFDLSSIVITLGGATILGGLSTQVSGGKTIVSGLPKGLIDFVRGQMFGLPRAFFLVMLIALVLWYVLEQTPVGRYLYATGSGREAARLAGVRTKLLVIAAFTLAGAIAGAAGVLQTAQSASASPAVGPGLLLPTFAAVFLGQTTVRVGRYNVPGMVIAILVLAAGVNGLQHMGAAEWVKPIFYGSALILAMVVGRLSDRWNATRRVNV